jgi:hypothetical protein
LPDFQKINPASGYPRFSETLACFKFKNMLKIKKGCVMNAREKTEFDRVNALPRKTSSRVDYYKTQTNYQR